MFGMSDEDDTKDLALLIASNCVRNTVIEDYHAAGKLNQEEMQAFNKQVANKIYTFLTYVFEEDRIDNDAFWRLIKLGYPKNWDEPELDQKFVNGVAELHAEQPKLDGINKTH